MRNDTKTSAARAMRREEPTMPHETEDIGIMGELTDHYKEITGNRIAPVKVLEHLARSDVKIYGSEKTATQESHAQDALGMSRLAPKELKLPMLFHDVGKAGPDYDNSALSKLVAKMYAYNFPYKEQGLVSAEVPVEIFLKSLIDHETQLKDAAEAAKMDFLKNLRDMLDLPEGASMRDFYDAHIQWGVELQEKSQFIDKSTTFAAFGHHILPGIMPHEIKAIRDGQKKPGRGNVCMIRDFAPRLEDIKLAAGAQTLDYCNARFTRSETGVIDAAKQTREALFLAIDNGGYARLIEAYKEMGVEINLSEDDIAQIKEYIDKILVKYQEQVRKSARV